MSVKMSTMSNVPIGVNITWHLYPGSPAPDKPCVDSYITVVAPQERRPFVCPVCGGRGTVSRGFYDWIAASTTDDPPEKCRSCCSTGIVWIAEVSWQKKPLTFIDSQDI